MAAASAPSPSALALAVAVAVVYSLVILRVNEAVDAPYMDEIFHVPQAQKYCAGRYTEWDPKITTFPGVYIAGVALARVANAMGLADGDAFCSMEVLRFVNVLFAVGNAWLIVRLRSVLAPTDKNALLHAAMVTSFPVLSFFSFLFYTDAGATFFVLLMYWLATNVDLRVRPVAPTSFLSSALAGAVAVLFRQTNIVWVVFVTGSVVVRFIEISQGQWIYGSSKQDAKLHPSTLVVRNSVARVLMNFVVSVVSELAGLLRVVWPFVAVVAAFVVFLVKNGGIVVGDKSNHEAGFHGAQVLYFIFVASTGFGVSLFAPSQIHRFADSVRRNSKSLSGLVFLFAALSSVVLVIHFFSPVHKFMLADNRHYTFYVWRKFFLKHRHAKFIPSLLYVFQAWRSWTELRRTRTPLWLLVFGIATILVLVPSPLVEPRYYLIPFVLLHLHTPPQPAWQLATTIVGFTVVNIATLYIFLYRPYQWVDGTTARFMW